LEVVVPAASEHGRRYFLTRKHNSTDTKLTHQKRWVFYCPVLSGMYIYKVKLVKKLQLLGKNAGLAWVKI
jgi:hypothetical protein